jgi:hypothetical protein
MMMDWAPSPAGRRLRTLLQDPRTVSGRPGEQE